MTLETDNVEPTDMVDNPTPDLPSNSLLSKSPSDVIDTKNDVIDTSNVIDTTTTTPPSRQSMDDFIKTLPSELQDDKSWSKFNDPQSLAQSYIELQKLVGYKGDFVGPDATPEDIDVMWSKLGKPNDSADYGITLPDNLKGLEGALEKTQSVIELAHKSNLTVEQAKPFLDGLFELESIELDGIHKNQLDATEADANRLKEVWGHGFDDMVDQVMALENRLGIFDEFETNGLNANPSFLQLMGTIAGEMAETSTISTAIASTPVGIESELRELQGQIRGFLQKGESVPEHLQSRRMELFEKMG